MMDIYAGHHELDIYVLLFVFCCSSFFSDGSLMSFTNKNNTQAPASKVRAASCRSDASTLFAIIVIFCLHPAALPRHGGVLRSLLFASARRGRASLLHAVRFDILFGPHPERPFGKRTRVRLCNDQYH